PPAIKPTKARERSVLALSNSAEQMQYLLNNPLAGAAVRLQYVIRQAAIKWIALAEQSLDTTARIRHLKQRTLFIFRCARQELINRRRQIDHSADGFEFRMIFRVHNDTATGGHHVGLDSLQVI